MPQPPRRVPPGRRPTGQPSPSDGAAGGAGRPPARRAVQKTPTSAKTKAPNRPSRVGTRPPGGRESGTKITRASGTQAAVAAPPAETAIKAIGLSLGAKFTSFISATVLMTSLILVVFAYSRTADEFDSEINESGCRLVRVMAATGTEYWKELQDHPLRTMFGAAINKHLDDFTAKLKAANVPAAQINEQSQARYKEMNEIFGEFIRKLNEYAKENPLAGLRARGEAPEIINLAVVDNNLFTLADVANVTEEINLAGQRPLPWPTPDNIKVNEGFYSSGDVRIRTRMYDKEIVEPDGRKSGHVVLYLSAQKIDEVQGRLFQALMIPLIVACVLGGGVGFFLSRRVTRPIKTLMQDINRVAQGDLDHQTRPHSRDEIGVLARTFNAMTKSLKVAQEKEIEHMAMEHELNIASEIQGNLLPKRIPKIGGVDIAAFYKPSKEVGGDYYDFIPIDERHMAVVVADVSGKGVPGSMVMTMARALIRMEGERNLSSSDTLKKVNRILARDIKRGMFVTCLYLIMDLQKLTITVASAGHNPLVLYRQAQNKYELVNPNGIALGFDKGPIFDRTIKEQVVQLYAGDRFVSYTDGVVESMSPANEEFGDERFYNLVQQLARRDSNQFTNIIVQSLDEHQADGPQHDDITIVTMRIQPS